MARSPRPFLLALPLAASLGLPATAQNTDYPTCIDAGQPPCILDDGTLLEAFEESGVDNRELVIDPPAEASEMDGETFTTEVNDPTLEPEMAPEPEAQPDASYTPDETGLTELEQSEPGFVEDTAPTLDGTDYPTPETESTYPEEAADTEPAPAEPMTEEPAYNDPAYADPAYVESTQDEPAYMDDATQDFPAEAAPSEPQMDPTTEVFDPMTGEATEVPPWDSMPAPQDPAWDGETGDTGQAPDAGFDPQDPNAPVFDGDGVVFDPVDTADPMPEPAQTNEPSPDVEALPMENGGAEMPAPTTDVGGDTVGVEDTQDTTGAVFDEPVTSTIPTDAPSTGDEAGFVGAVDGEGVDGGAATIPPAPIGQAVDEIVAPNDEARAEAAADPEVQASVEALEEALQAPPAALEGTGAVLGTIERRVEEVRGTAQEYAGGVSAYADGDSARAQAAREREARRDRFESAGLGFIAGLAVGALINDRQEVVATAPERIIVLDRTTNVYQVWRDDDVLLRRPGTQETIRVHADGSTRTLLTYTDGTTVETIRDATGRVVWRQRTEGAQRVILIDERRPVGTIDIRVLPEPRVREIRIPRGIDPVFGAELVRSAHTHVDRTFSLGQIRNVWEIRRLAPTLATDPVLFDTGSTALGQRQAAALSGLAGVIQAMLEENPSEIFLVEGHTDAVGSAAFNLALSDRRAETVASALVEYFGIPPENLVFQGYGEALLRVPTLDDEPRNRRVEIRRITPLLVAQDH